MKAIVYLLICGVALAAGPSDSKKITDLAFTYLQKIRESGDYAYLDRAEKLTAQLRSESWEARRLRNEIGLMKHEFQTVVERSEAMLRENTSDPGVWANLGDALMERGEYARARTAYLEMFGRRPDLTSYNRLAYLSFLLGDAEGAIRLMEMAVEAGGLAENKAWCLAELGDLYFKTGHIEEARRSYQEAITLFPAMHRALAGLGKVDAAKGEVVKAMQEYRKAQAILPLVEYAAAIESLASKQGNAEEAKRQQSMIDLADRLAQANGEKTNRGLALVYADEGRKLDRALELIEAELKVRQDVYTWDAYAWVLFRAGRRTDAESAMEKALRYGTPEPLFQKHAAEIRATSDAKVETSLVTR